MKVKTNTRRKRTVLLLGSIGALLLLTAGLVAAYMIFTPKDEASPASSSEEVPSQGTNSPTTTSPSKGGQQTSTPSESGENAGGSGDSVQMDITAANVNAESLQVRVLIQAVWSSGVCTLTLTNGNSSVTKQASVQALASSATCQGFDVPMAELSSGTWTVRVSAAHDGQTTSTEQQITI